MSDIALIPVQGDFSADFALVGADLLSDQGMDTAIIISLFCDARADPDDELPFIGADRRGWWADAYAEIPGDVTGSKLWLLERGKQIPRTLVRAEQYGRDALQWLVDDGVASAIDVAASFPNLGWLGLEVTVIRPTGPARRHYDYVWKFA